MEQYFTQTQRVAIHLDNSEIWLAIDKTLTQLDKVIVPIPHFFSHHQIAHMVNHAGVDTVVCHPQAIPLWQSFGFETKGITEEYTVLYKTIDEYPSLPENTHKITFTSGTTSEPKGVCLSLSHLLSVGKSLAQVTKQFKVKKHMSLLPLSVLLENVACHYAAKYADVDIITPSLNEVGLTGSSQLDSNKLIHSLKKYQPDSLILMPQILKAIISYLQSNPSDLSFLKFIAVGGAVSSKGLLLQAQELNLPVFEGYGISECGSVISLNTDPMALGCVGKVLPHQQLKINDDGEILTKGQLFTGYLGEEKNTEEWYATGDLGKFDQQNNLHIIGRKNNIIINSFGRNISPDWIEAEIISSAEISQVAIFGEAKPFLTAICYTQLALQTSKNIINRINKSLPDYAQVKEIILTDEPFSFNNKMLTASGKIKREKVFNHYQQQLEEIYANA